MTSSGPTVILRALRDHGVGADGRVHREATARTDGKGHDSVVRRGGDRSAERSWTGVRGTIHGLQRSRERSHGERSRRQSTDRDCRHNPKSSENEQDQRTSTNEQTLISHFLWYLHVSHAVRRRTTKAVRATSNADRASSPPPTIHWTRQKALAGW